MSVRRRRYSSSRHNIRHTLSRVFPYDFKQEGIGCETAGRTQLRRCSINELTRPTVMKMSKPIVWRGRIMSTYGIKRVSQGALLPFGKGVKRVKLT